MEQNKIEETVYSKCYCQLLMYLNKVSEAAELMKRIHSNGFWGFGIESFLVSPPAFVVSFFLMSISVLHLRMLEFFIVLFVHWCNTG